MSYSIECDETKQARWMELCLFSVFRLAIGKKLQCYREARDFMCLVAKWEPEGR